MKENQQCYIQKVKGKFYYDIVKFCKFTFLAIVQNHNFEA